MGDRTYLVAAGSHLPAGQREPRSTSSSSTTRSGCPSPRAATCSAAARGGSSGRPRRWSTRSCSTAASPATGATPATAPAERGHGRAVVLRRARRPRPPGGGGGARFATFAGREIALVVISDAGRSSCAAGPGGAPASRRTRSPRAAGARRSGRRTPRADPTVNSTNVGGDGRGLGAEQDLGLLAAAHRVRVLGDEPAEEGVELAGGDPRLPPGERGVERRHQPVDVPAGPGGDVDPRRPLHPDELALDLLVEVVAPLLVDEVPLVEGDDERAAALLDRGDDPLVLLGQRLRAVDDRARTPRRARSRSSVRSEA